MADQSGVCFAPLHTHSTLVNYENPYRGRRTGPITSDYTAISYLPGVPWHERRHEEKEGDERKSLPDRLRYTPLPARYRAQLDPTSGDLITQNHRFHAAEEYLHRVPFPRSIDLAAFPRFHERCPSGFFVITRRLTIILRASSRYVPILRD